MRNKDSLHQRERLLMLPLLVLFSLCTLKANNSHVLHIVQAFGALVGLPIAAFVGGRLTCSIVESVKQSCTVAMRMTAWFVCSAVVSFWIAVAQGQKQALNLVSIEGMTGFFLLASLAALAMAQLESKRWKHIRVLLVAIALSLISAYVPIVPNLLGVRQFLAFFPLFLMGRWTNEKVNDLLDRPIVKVAGVVLTASVLALCAVKAKRLIAWSEVLNGCVCCSSTGSKLLMLGGVRLAQIVLGALLSIGLLSLCPKKNIPFVTQCACHWHIGFGCFPVVGALVMALPVSGAKGTLMKMALLVVLPVALCSKHLEPAARTLSRLPNVLVREQAFQLKEGKAIPSVYVRYSLLFVLLMSVFISSFALVGNSLIWIPDGENLYLVIMYYTRDYIVKAIQTLFTTGALVLPQWDFSIGQGAGVLSVLHINPFFLLALLFPRSMMEQVYAMTALLQLYLTGLLFLRFCRAIHKEQGLPTLTGALLYTFSGFGIFTASKHIYFITYLLMGFPLLLVACERWLQKKKFGMMLAVVVFLFCGSYYYMWMDSFLMAFYLLAREVYQYKNNVKRIVIDLVQLMGLYLWGFALSMAIFLPSVANLFDSSRSDTLGTGTKLFYSARHYQQLVTLFVSLRPDGQNWTRLGFTAIVFFAVVVLFTTRKRRELRPLQVMTVIFVLFLCSPFIGSLFNGFGYSSNRWSFGFAFLMALVVVYVFRDLVCIPPKKRRTLHIITGCYIAIVLVLDRSTAVVLSMVLLAVFWGILTLLNRMRDKQLAQRLLALTTLVALIFHITYYHSPNGLNQSDRFLERGTAEKNARISAEAVSVGLDDTLYRTETAGNRHNANCMTGGNGTNSYWSVLDGSMVEYYLDFDLDSVRQAYALWGLDQRASLCALAGVKYYAGKNAKAVPYGYTLRQDIALPEDTPHSIYQNEYALPFGYAYDSYITEEMYTQLSPLEKQQALLQGALVTEDNQTMVSASLTQTELSLTAQSVPFTVKEAENVKLNDTTFEVKKNGGSITLEFQALPDSETYLYLNQVTYDGKTDDAKVTVQGGGVKKDSNVYRKGTLYYFDRNGYTYLLGYHEKALKSCTITFESKGTYRADAIQIVSLPMADYRADVTALAQCTLQDVRETASGGLSGSIKLDKSRLLVFAVPWSKGWTLTVNGEPAKLMQVNRMYCGVVLPSGQYDIELNYTAVGLRTGVYISGVALAVLLGYEIAHLIQRSKRKRLSK